MNYKNYLKSALLAISLCGFIACNEDVDTSMRYVFDKPTVDSYLDSHDNFSSYYDLLGKVNVSSVSKTTVKQLLSARGHYTVFAPTNEAIQEYLDSLVKKDIIPEARWDAFPDSTTLDSIRKVIVYNSILDSGDDYAYLCTANFPTKQDGELEVTNMMGRKLSVRYGDSVDDIRISGCRIDRNNRDIETLNGVIHVTHDVIAPPGESLGQLLSSIVSDKKEGFYVMAQLAMACGLTDTLSKIRDEVYELKYLTGEINAQSEDNFYTPEHRYYGFTCFAESDALWSQLLGKPALDITVEDVMSYIDQQGIYPEAKRDKDYKSADNLLNQFVTYHFLPERLSADILVYHRNEIGYNKYTHELGVAVMEFYVTMGKTRLLKIYESRESNGVYLNRFPKLDNGRRGTYHEVSCDPDKEGIKVGDATLTGEYNVRNGIIYSLDKILWYSDETRKNMQNNRIRWDVTSMMPEFMNNDIRNCEITDEIHQNVWIPSDATYKYLSSVDVSQETKFYYWPGTDEVWTNMQKDEFTIRGLYELTFQLPPVPRRGVYELRYGLQSGGSTRGMCQVFWGSDKDKMAAADIPLDLRQGGNNRHTAVGDIPRDIGYADDTDDDDYNAEVDKRMRSHGFMKSCNQFYMWDYVNGMRHNLDALRAIVLRETLDPDKTYYMKFKTVLDDPTRYFYMDFLEFCPKEVYDNPTEPEDIW